MRLSKFKYLFQNRALVLMYHRINSPLTDPWNLSVSPENFEAQLQFLTKHYSIVSIHELTRQINSGKIQNRSVALTFDDGYLDNFTTAKPLLEKYSVPATFFITDSYLGGQPFWWDELEAIIVHTDKLPSVFSVSFRNETIVFGLEGEEVLNEEIRLNQVNYSVNRPPTLRTQLYIKLWKLLSPLQKDDQMEFLKLVRDWAGISENQTQVEGTMTVQQLKQLSDNPLFTIGGHTSTHPSLSDHPATIQKNEIADNKEALEKLISDRILYFAYPSGRYNKTTIKTLKNRSFSAAFTTNSGFAGKSTDKYTVPRVQVCNWDVNKLQKKVQAWFRM